MSSLIQSRLLLIFLCREGMGMDFTLSILVVRRVVWKAAIKTETVGQRNQLFRLKYIILLHHRPDRTGRAGGVQKMLGELKTPST